MDSDAVRAMWAEYVERWKESGLSAKEFAAQSGINAQSLSWWKWRLAGGEPKAKRRQPSKSRAMEVTKSPALSSLSFVEVKAAVMQESLEVVLASALRVRVPTGFDDATLGRLLDLLEKRR
jgi:transposase